METTALQIFTDTVKVDKNEQVFIQPLCDFFKIDTDYQVDKIKKDPILSKSYEKNRNMWIFGDNYPRVSLSKKGFLRWIQLLNPNIIDENLRPQFLIYQELIFDYMLGSAEEQKRIGDLNAKLQDLKTEYGRLGAEVKATQKALFEALNQRYQYSLPFSDATTTTAITQ